MQACDTLSLPAAPQLKALGIDNIMRFDWPAAPPPEAMVRALELLFAIGVLDDHAKLTSPTGFQVAELPLVSLPPSPIGGLSSWLTKPCVSLCMVRYHVGSLSAGTHALEDVTGLGGTRVFPRGSHYRSHAISPGGVLVSEFGNDGRLGDVPHPSR